MSTLPIPLPCLWSGRILTLRGHFALVYGPWVNLRHGRGPRAPVAVLANHGTDEWLLSEAIVDLVRIYTYCSGDDADYDVSKYLFTMAEERGNFPDADNLRSNLLEVYSKMRSRLKDKLTNVLAPHM